MAEITPIGITLANVRQNSQAPSFELTFNQVQNTIIRRLNDDIDRVNESGAVDRHEAARLQREAAQIVETLPLIEAYRVGVTNNQGQLGLLYDEVTAAISALGDDDAVSTEEVAAFEAARDQVVERLDGIFIFVHPDIVDGDVIERLKDQIDDVRNFTAAVGTKSGDNADLVTSLETLQNEVSVAQTVNLNTVTTALDFEQKLNAEFATRETDLTELTVLDLQRKEAEIEAARADAANLLSAISLTFEANDNFAAQLNEFLQPRLPEPGSVLNLFV